MLLVGAGNRGRTWARVGAESPLVKLVAIVDEDLQRARSVAAQVAADPVVDRDVATAIPTTKPEAVIVATPPHTHYSLVASALSAGLHVLCEKPISDAIDETVALATKAEEHHVTLMAGMNFRYLSTSQRIRETVQSGRLGALGHGMFSYVRHRDGERQDINDYPLTMSHPMLLEQSIHHFDLLRYCYCAEVETLVADAWRPSWSTYDGDCCVAVLFRFENGVRANYVGTWTASWNKMSFCWRSEFASGALIQGSQFDDLFRVDFEPHLGRSGSLFKRAEEAEPRHREKLEPCVPFVDDSRLLLAALVDAVRGNAEPTTTGRDHLRTLCVVRACIESLQTGGWVNLADFHAASGIPPLLLATPPV